MVVVDGKRLLGTYVRPVDRFMPAKNAETGYVLAFYAGVDKLLMCTYSILRRTHNVSGDRTMYLYQHRSFVVGFRAWYVQPCWLFILEQVCNI